MRKSWWLAAAGMASAAVLAGCGEGAEVAGPSSAGASAETAEPKLTLADLPAPYSEADLDNGKSEFAKCRNCHSLDPAQGHMVGPNLHGVFERHPGSAEKFRYSEPLKAIALERWTPEELDKWLANPKGYLPGSSMFFNGIDDPNARRDVIAYLLVETR